MHEVGADGESVLLVSPGDPRALSRGICRLLQDPPVAAALGAGTQQAFLRNGLTAEAMVAETVGL